MRTYHLIYTMELNMKNFRLCFGILDKIAEGICYLFDLDVGENENIYFESFWQHYKENLTGGKK